MILPKDTPQVLLAKYKNEPDPESDPLEDLVDFVESTDLILLGLFGNPDEEDLFYVNLRKIVDIFILNDNESQTKIKRAEQQQLEKWKESVSEY